MNNNSSDLADLQQALQVRQLVLGAVRRFFDQRGYLEVPVPVRIPTPALEDYIDAIPADGHFLRTSPELHLKRYLAAGYERIYHIGPCFRQGEYGPLHHPEYSMLEWYRVDCDYMSIADECAEMIEQCALAATGSSMVLRGHQRIDLASSWQRVAVSDAFKDAAGWDPALVHDADRFDFDLVEKVEPSLPHERPVQLYNYPAAQAALARRCPADPLRAERWELYIDGVEIANAYTELVDPVEQRARFEACAEGRRQRGQEVYPIDESFMAALDEGIPLTGGIALGLDRLIMILNGSNSLDEVLPFRSEQDPHHS